jgi:hypothetical protein
MSLHSWVKGAVAAGLVGAGAYWYSNNASYTHLLNAAQKQSMEQVAQIGNSHFGNDFMEPIHSLMLVARDANHASQKANAKIPLSQNQIRDVQQAVQKIEYYLKDQIPQKLQQRKEELSGKRKRQISPRTGEPLSVQEILTRKKALEDMSALLPIAANGYLHIIQVSSGFRFDFIH